jgi:hypothetical protein
VHNPTPSSSFDTKGLLVHFRFNLKVFVLKTESLLKLFG